MANTPSFNWETPDDTDLVKDGAAAIRTLGNAIDSSMTDLKGGTTGQVLSKASNTDMDFTWVAQDDSNAIQNALLTTTGDTIYASSASTPARLAIGTTGQVLTVSGGVPAWSTISAGSLTSLATGSLSGSTTTISSISGSYKSLRFDVRGLSVSTGADIRFRINGVSTNSYAYLTLQLIDLVSSSTADSGIRISGNAGLTSAGTSNFWTIQMPNYTDTSSFKIVNYNGAVTDTNYSFIQCFGSGCYNSTSAITSISIVTSGGTFDAGTYELFGVN